MHVAESSSAHPTVKQRRRDGAQVEVACPSVLPDYQAYMRGVDRGDQLQTYYNIGRHSTKWWERVFFYIVECAILNSYILDGNIRSAEHARKGRMNCVLTLWTPRVYFKSPPTTPNCLRVRQP